MATLGITGIGPGLTGGKNSTKDNVLKTASDMISHSRPRVALPR